MSQQARTVNQHANRNDMGFAHNVPIRAVYVGPIEHFKRRYVVEYFDRFGEVVNVDFRSNDIFNYASVTFKSANSAKAVLSMNWHSFGALYHGNDLDAYPHQNCHVFVKAADLSDQPDYHPDYAHPLLNPPEQDSSSHILNALNDHCLQEIFSSLPLNDLINAAEVCVRFNAIAKEVFSVKFQNLLLKSYTVSHVGFFDQHNDFVERLFRNFGLVLKSIDIADISMRADFKDFLLNRISHYCGASLKKVYLCGFKIKGLLSQNLRKKFANLNELKLWACDIEHAEELLGECQQLKSICLFETNFNDEGQLIEQRFAQLEKANINVFAVDDEKLIAFIKLNPTITKLVLGDAVHNDDSVVRAIVEYLPNLVSFEYWGLDVVSVLDFDDANENPKYFGQLKCLKKLDVGLDYQVQSSLLIQDLIKGRVPIEDLSIGLVENDESVFEDLVQLKGIKNLSISTAIGMNIEDMIKLVDELPQLKLLKLGQSNIIIDVEGYNKILATVQNNRKKETLQIVMYNEANVNVPEEMLEINRYWLRIDFYYTHG